MESMLDIRYRTFNIDLYPYNVEAKVICATGKDNDGSLYAQFSYCSPKDMKQFSRKIGQAIALNRLISEHAILIELKDGENVKQALKNVLVQEVKRKDIKWAANLTPYDIF